MRWLKKTIARWLHECEDEEFLISTRRTFNHFENERSLQDSPVLHFKIFRAVGGQIVEFRKLNSNSDWVTSTYIVGDDEDFGESIAHIINLENLKH
jgi:hypothetical protein